MDEEARKEEDDEKWAREKRERKERDEERTRKKREKRNKKKNAGKGKANGNGVAEKTNGHDADGVDGAAKKKPNLQVPRRGSRDEDHGSDFGVADVVKEVGITIHDDD